MAKSFGANWPLLVAVLAVVLGLTVFGVFLNWDGLSLTVKLQDLAGLLAPLAFASAVLERAVEILISPWRDAGASKLETGLAALKADANAKPEDIQGASHALDEYRGQTQKYAFAISLTLSLVVAMAGLRALGPFADIAKLRDGHLTPALQHNLFLWVDVGLSAAVLAGGADGIHSVMNAVTAFFDTSAAKHS